MVTAATWKKLNGKINAVEIVKQKGTPEGLGDGILIDTDTYCQYIGSGDSVCCERAQGGFCMGSTLGSNSCNVQY